MATTDIYTLSLHDALPIFVRFRALSMRMDLVGLLEFESWWKSTCRSRRNLIEEIVMAKVIEFYIPTDFRKPVKLARQLRSEEHTSELQSLRHLVCRLLLEK